MALPLGSHVLHKLIIGKYEQIFLSGNTEPKTLKFGMYHHLVDFYQVCANYAPGAKNGPTLGSRVYASLYKGNLTNLLVRNHRA